MFICKQVKMGFTLNFINVWQGIKLIVLLLNNADLQREIFKWLAQIPLSSTAYSQAHCLWTALVNITFQGYLKKGMLAINSVWFKS